MMNVLTTFQEETREKFKEIIEEVHLLTLDMEDLVELSKKSYI